MTVKIKNSEMFKKNILVNRRSIQFFGKCNVSSVIVVNFSHLSNQVHIISKSYL